MSSDSRRIFEEPRAQVVRLDAADVIATSGEPDPERVYTIDTGYWAGL